MLAFMFGKSDNAARSMFIFTQIGFVFVLWMLVMLTISWMPSVRFYLSICAVAGTAIQLDYALYEIKRIRTIRYNRHLMKIQKMDEFGLWQAEQEIADTKYFLGELIGNTLVTAVAWFVLVFVLACIPLAAALFQG